MATSGGAWILYIDSIVFVADDGTSTSNLMPSPPGDGELAPWFGLAPKVDGSAGVYWGEQEAGEDRYAWRYATVDQAGAMTDEVGLPGALFYSGIAFAQDGEPVFLTAGRTTSVVRMIPGGLFVRDVLPSSKKVGRGGAVGPVVASNGDIYVSVERTIKVHRSRVRVGHEVWGVIDGDLRRVFAEIPGAGSGAMISSLVTEGSTLAVVSGLQGSGGGKVSSTIRTIEQGEVIEAKATRKPPGVPGFDHEGSAWWFPDGVVFDGSLAAPIYHLLPSP